MAESAKTVSKQTPGLAFPYSHKTDEKIIFVSPVTHIRTAQSILRVWCGLQCLRKGGENKKRGTFNKSFPELRTEGSIHKGRTLRAGGMVLNNGLFFLQSELLGSVKCGQGGGGWCHKS